MQVDFQRTLRGLAHERKSTATHYVLLSILVLLFAGGFVWLSWARVPLYEVSASARIETGDRGLPVVTVLPGRVARVNVRLVERVKAGAVLVELDIGRTSTLLARITARAAQELELESGKQVWALIKAVSLRGHLFSAPRR